MSLKILIIGAGIGGLTTALALRRQGHEVLIFEKSRFAEEIGAAINISPNCTRLLRRFGMEPLKYQAIVCEGLTQCSGSGEIDRSMDIWHGESQDEKDWYLIHRAHLHTALKDLATAEHGEGKPAKLFLGSRLVNLDAEAGEIELSSGEKFTGDLIVGADGVHSWSRTYVDPDARPFAAGKSCFRWLNPFSQLEGDELTKVYSDLTGHIVEWAASDRRMIYYPCANHTIANFAGFVPMEEVSGLTTGWTGAGSKPALLKAFETFGPGPRRILEQAPEEDLKLWTLLDMKPLDNWCKGRLALLGDAAHPFMPFAGQGGAMAIEDAAAMAALLTPGTASRDVPEKLRMYQECRQERADRIQEFTRKNGRDLDNVDLPRPSPQETMEFFSYCTKFDQWEAACQLASHSAGSQRK